MQEHWLAKAWKDVYTIDHIDGSKNFWATVDELWITRSRPVRMLGVDTHVIPLEELIWSKSYVMARERFDGADVAHLILLQFFFSSRRRHTRWTGDWSSDVCSSDLLLHYRRRRELWLQRGRFCARQGRQRRRDHVL